MATLVSAGVSVTIVDDSFYVPVTAPTVPLFFVATRADKKKVDGVTAAPGAGENGVVRTITSLNQSVDTYGIPFFRTDLSDNPQHGDARNEYGLFALNQFLTVGNRAYVIRADVDLADSGTVTYSIAGNTSFTGVGNGALGTVTINQTTAAAELWTLVATSATNFTVTGFVSGSKAAATVGTAYNNGTVSFTITAGGTPFVAGDTFTFNVASNVSANGPLGSTDAARRTTIVTALASAINLNDDIRSEMYEFNLILCPGYHEVIDELLQLNDSINDEAFVIADTPFNKDPAATATWGSDIQRQHNTNVAYYYPHAIASNLDGLDCFVAASGVALKTYANSDNVSEVWFPPAGPRRGVVTGVSNVGYVTGTLGTATTFVSTPLSQGQRDALYEFGKNINPIPFFMDRGILVFGQKTSSSTASALDRVNVVRMLCKIKREIRKGAFSYLFELNDRITRESIKQMIDDYLNDIMQRRGIYDYVVICDETNNTPVRIDRNEMWVDVAIKPAKAVEFIYIPIKVVNTGDDLN